MAPFVPGGRCHGCGGVFAKVQPQEVCTLLITTSEGETLVRLNVKLAVASPTFALYSLESASQASELAAKVGCAGTATGMGAGIGLGGAGNVKKSVARGGGGGGRLGAKAWARTCAPVTKENMPITKPICRCCFQVLMESLATLPGAGRFGEKFFVYFCR